MVETKAMIKGFRHVPQYDDMLKEIFEKTPGRAPDRTALQLYESPAYAFYWAAFCADERLSHEKFDGGTERDGDAHDSVAKGKAPR